MRAKVISVAIFVLCQTSWCCVANAVIEVREWKTYQNEKYRFQIEYPSDWRIVAYPDNPHSSGVAFQAADYSGFAIGIYKCDLETLSDCLVSRDKVSLTAYEGRPSKSAINRVDIRIANQQAVQRIETWWAAGFTTIMTYIKKNELIYTFQLDVGSELEYSNEDARTYHAILSTFRFVKEDNHESN